MNECARTVTGAHHFKDDEFYIGDTWRLYPVCIFCGLVDDRKMNIIEAKEPPKRDRY